MRHRVSGGQSAVTAIEPLALSGLRMPEPSLFSEMLTGRLSGGGFDCIAAGESHGCTDVALLVRHPAPRPSRKGARAQRGWLPGSSGCRACGRLPTGWAAKCGDFASATVIEAAAGDRAPASASDLLTLCEDRVLKANARLSETARERGEYCAAAPPLPCYWHTTNYYACMWSGDSRIYPGPRRRDSANLARPHRSSGDCMQPGPAQPGRGQDLARRRNVITRAIGVDDEPELEMEHGCLEDLTTSFIICSDGLTAHVSDSEILDCVNDRLIAAGLRGNGCAHAGARRRRQRTVVVVRYRADV